MEAKHAPRLWKVVIWKGEHDTKYHVIADNESCIASFSARENGAVNAHLIAAAPDLLEAVENLLPMWSSGIDEPWIKQAREAVRKAKGEVR